MARNLFENENKRPIKREPRNLFENLQPQEEESFLSKLPRNITIGATKAGQNLHNYPREITEGLENRLGEIGANFNGLPTPEVKREDLKISPYFPYDPNDYAKLLGGNHEPTFTDTAVQKGIEFLPEVLTSRNALRDVIPYMTKRGATKNLNKAQKIASEREIGALNVNPELIEDARQFLPNLLRNRKALEASHAGDYNSLFKLQSEVGQLAGKQAKSFFSPTERIKGRAGLEARGNLLDAIHQNLQSLGHHDISELLKKGQEEYRKYMKFRKFRNYLLGAGAAYAAPKNPLTDLVKNLWAHSGQ